MIVILRLIVVFLELGDCRCDHIAKTYCIVIFDFDTNHLLLGTAGGELLLFRPDMWEDLAPLVLDGEPVSQNQQRALLNEECVV